MSIANIIQPFMDVAPNFLNMLADPNNPAVKDTKRKIEKIGNKTCAVASKVTLVYQYMTFIIAIICGIMLMRVYMSKSCNDTVLGLPRKYYNLIILGILGGCVVFSVLLFRFNPMVRTPLLACETYEGLHDVIEKQAEYMLTQAAATANQASTAMKAATAIANTIDNTMTQGKAVLGAINA